LSSGTLAKQLFRIFRSCSGGIPESLAFLSIIGNGSYWQVAFIAALWRQRERGIEMAVVAVRLRS